MSDEDPDEEKEKEAAAHVWARGGEGPHAVVEPGAAPTEEAKTEAKQSMADLQDLVVMAAGAAPSPVTAPAAGETEKVNVDGAADQTQLDGKEGPAQTDGEAGPAPAEAGDEGEDEGEGEDEEEEATPTSDGSPTNNDLAVGYMLPLILYFVFYLVNVGAGGYCLSSERMNALAEIGFYWTPALCALCLLLGGKWMKVTGAVLFVPLVAAAVYAGNYFHTYERFQTQISTYGPLANAYDANGWRICRYESSWVVGNMPGTTYTREKDVAPYVVYTKKMRLGEPP